MGASYKTYVWTKASLKPAPTILVLALGLMVALGCGGGSATYAEQSGGEVRGLVVEVVGRNIAEVETLRIRDDAGNIWTFVTDEGFIGMTPSHLREHQLLGLSLLVHYESRGDSLVAVDICD